MYCLNFLWEILVEWFCVSRCLMWFGGICIFFLFGWWVCIFGGCGKKLVIVVRIFVG